MSEIRILLADDHTVLRQGIAQALETQSDIAVVAQGRTGKEAVALAKQHHPDVILMDIKMPELDGVAAAKQITAQQPQIGIIILTAYRRDDYVFEAIKAGASGYLLKEVDLKELLNAIRWVSQGEVFIDPAIARRVLAQLCGSHRPLASATSEFPRRDLEILQLMAQGLSNQEVADKLSLVEKEVRNRLSLIIKQLHLENRRETGHLAG